MVKNSQIICTYLLSLLFSFATQTTFQKTGFDFPWKLAPNQTICIEFQYVFWKKKKNQSVVSWICLESGKGYSSINP